MWEVYGGVVVCDGLPLRNSTFDTLAFYVYALVANVTLCYVLLYVIELNNLTFFLLSFCLPGFKTFICPSIHSYMYIRARKF